MNLRCELEKSIIEKFKVWLITEGKGKVQAEIVDELQLLVWKSLQLDYSELMRIASSKKIWCF